MSETATKQERIDRSRPDGACLWLITAALACLMPLSLINVVLYGAHEAAPGTESWPKMSGFELSVGLDYQQIAALCTYVRSSWGNRAGPVAPADVAKQH